MDSIAILARHLLDQRLDQLRVLHELGEEALARHDGRVDEWFEEQRIVADDDEDRDYREYLERLFDEEKASAQRTYPQLMRAAIYGTAYGVFEHFLISLCRQSEPLFPGPGLKDLRGEGITRARLYLTKVARVPFQDTSAWGDLKTYSAIRNSVVHAQGDLTASGKLTAIQDLQKRLKTFLIGPSGEKVELGNSFTPTFLKCVTLFSEELWEAVLLRHK